MVRRVRHGQTEVEFEIAHGNSEKIGVCREGTGSSGEQFRRFRVFLGSPSGLELERDAFCDEVEFFNTTHADAKGVNFKVERWEEIPPDYGRPQSHIDELLARCHCYVLILYDRWGSPPGVGNGGRYTSGSEEEFCLAERWLYDERFPMSKIAVYFKEVEAERLKSGGEQLRKVMRFKDRIQRHHRLLHNEFREVEDFRRRVQVFMAKWLNGLTIRARPMGVRSVLDFDEPGGRTKGKAAKE